jgi:hypothetical protein
MQQIIIKSYFISDNADKTAIENAIKSILTVIPERIGTSWAEVIEEPRVVKALLHPYEGKSLLAKDGSEFDLTVVTDQFEISDWAGSDMHIYRVCYDYRKDSIELADLKQEIRTLSKIIDAY